MKSRRGSPRLGTKAGAFQERYLFQIHRLAHNASPGIGVISNSKNQHIIHYNMSFFNFKHIFELLFNAMVKYTISDKLLSLDDKYDCIAKK